MINPLTRPYLCRVFTYAAARSYIALLPASRPQLRLPPHLRRRRPNKPNNPHTAKVTDAGSGATVTCRLKSST